MTRPHDETLTPVFVLGQQRSGTTWLANMLAAHPAVAAVQAPEHQGVHESVFFSHFAACYGDLADEARFETFCEQFGASDYFQLTGLSGDWLKGQRSRAYADLFRSAMDALGRRTGASHWLEKSPHHSLLADELGAQFPDAWFIAIVRTPAFQIISQLHHQDTGLPPLHARLAIYARKAGAWSLYSRYLKRFCARHPRAILLRYEDLSANPEGAMRHILDRLGLAFEPSILSPPFRRNTRFRSTEERDKAIGKTERQLCNAIAYAMGAIPLGLLLAIERRIRRKRGVEWPPWVWTRSPERAPTALGKAAAPGGCLQSRSA